MTSRFFPPDNEDDWTLEHWRSEALRLRRKVYVLGELLRYQEAASRLPFKDRKAFLLQAEKAMGNGSAIFVISRSRGPSRRELKAMEVLSIREELESKGRRVTDMDALREWYGRQGLARLRALSDRTALNAVSKLRQQRRLSRSGLVFQIASSGVVPSK
jgi:hypothetical protein